MFAQNRAAKPLSAADQESLDRQARLLKELVKLPVHEAAGIACSLLLQLSVKHPSMLRTLLNEPVVREGFRGTSLLACLTRASKE